MNDYDEFKFFVKKPDIPYDRIRGAFHFHTGVEPTAKTVQYLKEYIEEHLEKICKESLNQRDKINQRRKKQKMKQVERINIDIIEMAIKEVNKKNESAED